MQDIVQTTTVETTPQSAPEAIEQPVQEAPQDAPSQPTQEQPQTEEIANVHNLPEQFFQMQKEGRLLGIIERDVKEFAWQAKALTYGKTLDYLHYLATKSDFELSRLDLSQEELADIQDVKKIVANDPQVFSYESLYKEVESIVANARLRGEGSEEKLLDLVVRIRK